MKVWCVVADAAGAHEADCVYSLWTTQDKAELEIARLKTEHVSAGCYGGEFHVVSADVDSASDEWIGAISE